MKDQSQFDKLKYKQSIDRLKKDFWSLDFAGKIQKEENKKEEPQALVDQLDDKNESISLQGSVSEESNVSLINNYTGKNQHKRKDFSREGVANLIQRTMQAK